MYLHSRVALPPARLKCLISCYCTQDITVKWEKIRHPDTTAAQRLEIVHEIMEQVKALTSRNRLLTSFN